MFPTFNNTVKESESNNQNNIQNPFAITKSNLQSKVLEINPSINSSP